MAAQSEAEAQTLTIAATDHGRRQMWTLELADGEKAVALLPHDQPVVLSDEAFYRLQGQDWRRTPIVQVGPPSHVAIGVPVAALTTDGRSLYVGYNMGEWGGELDRIDLATGHEVECWRQCNGGHRRSTACRVCDRLYGLVHMIQADGNLQRMCGDQAEILYSRPLTGEILRFRATRSRSGVLRRTGMAVSGLLGSACTISAPMGRMWT